jgi:hypothetical protein
MFSDEVTRICCCCCCCSSSSNNNNNSVRRILLLFKYIYSLLYDIILYYLKNTCALETSLKTEANQIPVVSLRLVASRKPLYPKSVTTSGYGRQARRLVATTCRTLETVPKVELSKAFSHVKNVIDVINDIRKNSITKFETYFKNASDMAALVGEEIRIPRLCGRQTTRYNIQTTE